jgi:hypothetical protein
MPPTLRRRIPSPPERVIVAPRVADALRPEHARDLIPRHVLGNAGDVPFDGELREEMSAGPFSMPANSEVVRATLRRPWLYVGCAIDPGNTAGPGLQAALRLPNARFTATILSFAINGNGFAQAFPAIICGSRAELVLQNTTGSTLTGLKVAIWGMSER